LCEDAEACANHGLVVVERPIGETEAWVKVRLRSPQSKSDFPPSSRYMGNFLRRPEDNPGFV
jgi:hypothetical protein